MGQGVGVREISPHLLVEARHIRVVDVREPWERQEGTGIIPGSRLFPMGVLLDDPEVLLASYPTDTPIALACMSGRRSGLLVPVLEGVGYVEVYNLVGGMLGWGGAGLPAAAMDFALSLETPPSLTVEQAARALVSCFVAESVQNALNRDRDLDAFDPRALVDTALALERPADGRHTLDTLLRALDRVAEIARIDGHPIATIAANMDRMRALFSGAR